MASEGRAVAAHGGGGDRPAVGGAPHRKRPVRGPFLSGGR